MYFTEYLGQASISASNDLKGQKVKQINYKNAKMSKTSKMLVRTLSFSGRDVLGMRNRKK